jgi:prephenate dehydrogenase
VTADRTAAPEAAGLPSRIAFIGFGLIGGSIAAALSEAGVPSELVAWSPSGDGPRAGLAAGLIDTAATSAAEAIRDSDLIVLAGPPLAVLDWIDQLAGPQRGRLAEGATVTDVASTKSAIVARAEARHLPFVGGHPMAGREASGVAAATAELFSDRPWVIVETSTARAHDLARAEALATLVGARPIHLTAVEHDAAVAAISHLPLVAAVALVEAVSGAGVGLEGWATARVLAASGWADMTRLARGNPTMGAGILATNSGPIVAELRAYRDVIDAWIQALDGSSGPVDADSLIARLEAARATLAADPAT